MHENLSIQLLGGFMVAVDGEPLSALNTPRLQALLAYLLLHRHTPQSRQHIAFLFWPDSSETQAQSNLRNLVVTLRRAFPSSEHFIAIDRRAMQWRNDSSFALDLLDFEGALAATAMSARSQESPTHFSPGRIRALRSAVDLYTGDLLPGCYDEWITGPRERLRNSFLDALQHLVSAFEEANDLNSAILYARRMLRHDPLQEGLYRQLMRLYSAAGDGASAIAVYRNCEAILKRELGVEPSQSTRDMSRQVERTTHRSAERAPRSAETAQPAPSIPNNLPAPLTPFIGRERDISRILDLLRAPNIRLITLTGTPGTGKTRLALQIGYDLVGTPIQAGGGDRPQGRQRGIKTGEPLLQVPTGFPDFVDGVYFVPLASIEDPGLVAQVVARAVGVVDSTNCSTSEVLLEQLRDKSLLLILDNFEHLLPAASLVAELLSACPRIKIVVTSRAGLNLRGEHEYPLVPMSVPGRDAFAQPDDLMQYESVALFTERAQEMSPGFALTGSNARAVGEICRRLEGIPLAIELASARVKLLSPEAILSRLDRRLKLLVGGKLDLPPRQRTLATAIAWSYNLLDPAEQALFRSLAIFSGGWTLDAAEALMGRVGYDADILESISSLANKSLLFRLDGDAETSERALRFGMLETIREYAHDKLLESGDKGVLEREHALYFMALAEASVGELDGPRQHEWTDKLDREHDNLRAALSWSIARDDAEVALHLSSTLGLFWERRGYLSEGRLWIRRALGLPSGVGSRYRAEALHYGGLLASRQRDYTEAALLLQQSRLAFQQLGDRAGESNALSALAIMTADRDLDTAIDLHLQSLQLRRALGDKVGIARTLQNLSYVKMHQEELDEASSLADEALALYRELESRQGIAFTLYVLAMVAAKQGDHMLASARFDECLEICHELRNNWLAAWVLGALGNLYYRTGCYDEANRTIDEAWDLFTEMGDKLGMAHTLVARGREAQRCCDYAGAGLTYRTAIALGRELNINAVVGNCIAGFAGLASAAGRYRDAALLFGLAEKLLNEDITGIEREQMTFGLAEARSALGDDGWLAAWAEGEAMTLQEALVLATDV